MLSLEEESGKSTIESRVTPMVFGHYLMSVILGFGHCKWSSTTQHCGTLPRPSPSPSCAIAAMPLPPPGHTRSAHLPVWALRPAPCVAMYARHATQCDPQAKTQKPRAARGPGPQPVARRSQEPCSLFFTPGLELVAGSW
jgi:hypothetical protein